jgi:hypothetical protein
MINAVYRQITSILVGVVLMPVAVFAETPAPNPSSTPKEKLGVVIKTTVGDRFLLGFRVTGPAETIKPLADKLLAFGCPKPLVKEEGVENNIFAPYSDHCDLNKAVLLLTEIRGNKYPGLHALDVMIFPVPKSGH